MSTQSPAVAGAAVVHPPAPPAAAPPIIINSKVRIPGNITTLDAFRQWARSDDCPEKLRVAWLAGVLWVEVAMEQFYSHNRVKTEITRVLGNLVRETDPGVYLSDGMLLSHPQAGLCTIPDGIFVSYGALQSGQVRRVPNSHNEGPVELEGSPEMVVEVVSRSSEDKDLNTLPSLYHGAGVRELWRVDARRDLRFQILRWDAAGYLPTQLPDGWWRSDVFARDFQLTQDLDPLGQPRFTPQVRPHQP
jgi:Uma2 family endonuclease